ncbi:hypothetical protein ACFST9_12250 [Hymenobacter monticola]|uniref:DUF7948 domain-containing protein n=1 Tax=Hymenobacter monticola TaxID=1705399 RepID=A0ABY4B8H1_9BACT|nr:hypothetical protein [Hymenobacter monticola]UOE35039.1 hypothetical protein MTP16_05160 [Hymenobacter monticola]
MRTKASGPPLPGGTLFIEPAGFVYSLRDSAARPQHGAPAATAGRGQAYAVRFKGATAAALRGAKQLPVLRSYYLGSDPSRWATGVPGFRQVHYADVCPGVDATLYENDRQRLEYAFAVVPGARPGAIVLRYDGATGRPHPAAGRALRLCAARQPAELPTRHLRPSLLCGRGRRRQRGGYRPVGAQHHHPQRRRTERLF